MSTRKQGSTRRRKAVWWLAQAQQTVRRPRQDVHHTTALALVRAYDARAHEDVRGAHRVRNHHLAKSIADAGWRAFLALLRFNAAHAGRQGVRSIPRSRARAVRAVACSCSRASLSAGTPARTVGPASTGTTTPRRIFWGWGVSRTRRGHRLQASTWWVATCVA